MEIPTIQRGEGEKRKGTVPRTDRARPSLRIAPILLGDSAKQPQENKPMKWATMAPSIRGLVSTEPSSIRPYKTLPSNRKDNRYEKTRENPIIDTLLGSLITKLGISNLRSRKSANLGRFNKITTT